MNIGRLRHRLTIQRYTETQDAHGQTSFTWADLATVWGSVEPISGREYFFAQQVKSAVTHRIALRHYDGITAKDRIVFGTRVFNIESVRNLDERNREIETMAVEAEDPAAVAESESGSGSGSGSGS